MPSIGRSNTLAASTTVPNVLTGSTYEYPGANQVQIMMVVDAAGLGSTCNIFFGGRLVAEDYVIPQAPAAGAGPYPNEHMIVSEVIAQGEQLKIQLQDGGAGSTIRTQVKLTPVF